MLALVSEAEGIVKHPSVPVGSCSHVLVAGGPTPSVGEDCESAVDLSPRGAGRWLDMELRGVWPGDLDTGASGGLSPGREGKHTHVP